MLYKCVPRIELHLVLPERPPLSCKRVLRRKLHCGDCLIGCCSLVPDYRAVFGRVVRGICAKLDLQPSVYVRMNSHKLDRTNPKFVLRPMSAEVLGQPVAQLLSRTATLHLLVPRRHFVNPRHQADMAIILPKPKRTLRIKTMTYHIGIRQLERRSLLNCISPQLRRRTQLHRRIEVLLPQLHNLQTGRQIRQLDHRRIIEEEILRRSLWVRTGESLAFDAKNTQTQSARPGLLISLQKHRLIRIPGGYVVCLSWGLEEALLKVRWQVRQHGQCALHDALGFDVRCAEAVAVLVEVVLLHFVHCCAYFARCFFFIGLDGFDAGRVPCEVGIAGWRSGEGGFHVVVDV